jgi:hypothetical protein
MQRTCLMHILDCLLLTIAFAPLLAWFFGAVD